MGADGGGGWSEARQDKWREIAAIAALVEECSVKTEREGMRDRETGERSVRLQERTVTLC